MWNIGEPTVPNYTSWPAAFQNSLTTAYSNWNGSSATNNSQVLFNYYGTSLNGLPSADPDFPDPGFQPWHEWIAVDQSDLDDPDTLAETSLVRCLRITGPLWSRIMRSGRPGHSPL